jgi:hypothetical protein
MRPGAKPRVLVLSYTTFRMHKADVFRLADPDVVFCDEAHTLKNADAQVGMSKDGAQMGRWAARPEGEGD